jgi:hypothetical protein
MTASQYSRHRAVSRQHVARLIKTGALPMKGRLIDVVKADALLDDRPDAGEPAPGSQAERYSEARTIRTVFQAKLARLEFEKRQSKLVSREEVEQRIAQHLDVIGAGLEALADRLAGPVASERDAKRVHALMKLEITRELHRLSATLGGHADAAAPPKE